MLAERVKAGQLPAVDQRVPQSPCVGVLDIPASWIKPEIGKYGGTLRMVDYVAGHWGLDFRWVQWEPWLHTEGLTYDPDHVYGNVMKSFEMSPDYKTFTFHMREGMKFSDGSPFTTEDIRFWYEDILLNDKLTPSIPVVLRAGQKPDGPPLKVQVVDTYTFKISFDEPFGLFPAVLSTDQTPTIGSSAFLKKYHPKYTPLDQLEPLIKAAGFQPGEWWRLFTLMSNEMREPKDPAPTVNPYVVKSVSPTKWIMERNPYYFKVDAAGNQLPYIDTVETTIVQDVNAGTLMATAGQVDLGGRIAPMVSVPVLKQYEQEKGYRVLLPKTHAMMAELYLNLTFADPVWRQVTGDIRFRQALSLALDREQINKTIYLGFAKLPTTIPINQYDPAKAKSLLDAMGLNKTDSDGCRLGPDGKKFVVPIETLSVEGGDEIRTAELAAKSWNQVGICTTVKAMDRALFGQTADANQAHVITWRAHYARWPWQPGTLTGFAGYEAYKTYAPLWWDWYQSGGKQGEKPPDDYVTLRDLNSELWQTGDTARQKAIWEQIKKIVTDNVWIIPTGEGAPLPLVVNAKLGNVPNGPDTYQLEVISAAEMFYYK